MHDRGQSASQYNDGLLLALLLGGFRPIPLTRNRHEDALSKSVCRHTSSSSLNFILVAVDRSDRHYLGVAFKQKKRSGDEATAAIKPSMGIASRLCLAIERGRLRFRMIAPTSAVERAPGSSAAIAADRCIKGRMMKRFGLTLVALVATSSGGFAEIRPFTPSLACRTIAKAVAAGGGVWLSTGRGRFDRYVANQSECARKEQITPAWVPSADNSNCFVGYTCEHYFD
jgi:hypothetical protein